jgi:diguanylate cyclase (GGDEF)-like protein/PAS domain S-box-containing protein
MSDIDKPTPRSKRGDKIRRRVQDLQSKLVSHYSDTETPDDSPLFLDRLTALSPDLVCVADFDGYFLRVNPAMVSLVGLSRKEILNRPYLEFVHQDDHPETVRTAAQLAKGEELIQFENRYRTPSGEYRWISWRAIPDKDREVVYAIGRDVTEQKKAQALQAELAAIVESSDDAILSMNDEGVMLTWNKGAEAMFGYGAESVVGEHVAKLLKPHSTGNVTGVLEQVRRGERVIHHDMLGLTADGRELRLSVTVSPVISGDGTRLALVARDVTVQTTAQEELQRSEQRFRLLADKANDLISLHSLAMQAEYLSPAIERLLDFSPEEMVGNSLFDYIHPDDLENVEAQAATLSQGAEEVTAEFRLRRRDDSYVWVESTSRLIYNDAGEPWQIVSVTRDISDRKVVQEELVRLATTDALTGVSSRGHFLKLASEEVYRAQRYERPMAFVMLDIDNFKRINDTYGHAVGDEVLRAVAFQCRKILRTSDLLGRVGGEEFAAILPETNLPAAVETAQRLRAAVASAATPTGDEIIQVTASFGVASLAQSEDTLEKIMQRADMAMYKAKRDGRNQVVADW